MTSTITVPDAELHALATGEIVVAFVPRSSVGPGDEIELAAGGPLPPGELRTAYRRWADGPAPGGSWTAVVESVQPVTALDTDAGLARHLRIASPASGDLAVLRVFGDGGPVLSDRAFRARRVSLEGALGR